MKLFLGSEWKIQSHSPHLKNLAASHRTQKCYSVRFLYPQEQLAKSTRNGLGCDLQLGI
jgi:hypothetical protein